jgi:pyruvate dehydrogenase E1 component
VRWRESDHGQHIELGIAEVNLVGLLGELGATWSRDGQPLLPVGTIYDPFVTRAHEPWSFGIYAGGQSILVGTPSGVTLGPRAARTSRSSRPSIGIEQPGCVSWEPAFGQDFEWAFCARCRSSAARRQRGVLPAVDPSGGPGAARLPRRPRRAPRDVLAAATPGGGRAGRDDRRGRRVVPRGAGRRRGGRRERRVLSPDLVFRALQARGACARATTRSSTAVPAPSRSYAARRPPAHASVPGGSTASRHLARRHRVRPVGDIAELYAYHGIDAETVVGAALDLTG